MVRTTFASRLPKHFIQGTRVDCLYDGDYFRGTVDTVTIDHGRYLCKVCFDDGDVQDYVPQENMELPLEPRMRVECLFEDEEAYFSGVIGRDNGDATYRVEFDDGDVLDAAARRDIRIVSSSTNHEGAEGDEDQAQRMSLGDPQHVYNEHEGQNKSTTEDNAMGLGKFPAQGLSPSYSQASWTNDENGAGGSGVERSSVDSHSMSMTPDNNRYRSVDSTTAEEGAETFHDKDWADGIASTRSSGRFSCGINDLDDRAGVSPASHSRGWSNACREGKSERGPTEGGSSGCPDLFIEASRQSCCRSSEEAIPARGEGIDAPKGNHGKNKQQQHRSESTIGDHSDEGKRRVRSARAMNRSPAFQPSAPNPVHAYIEALAAAAPRLMEDAPPDFRLFAVSYQIAALLDQLRDEEARGETWSVPSSSMEKAIKGSLRLHSKQFDTGGYDTEKTFPEANEATSWGVKTYTLKAGMVAPTLPVHMGLRKVVEHLSKLRMRQVALVRLCYGDTSREMVQALCDLAESYVKEGLWLQVSNHVAKATNIMAQLYASESLDEGGAFCKAVRGRGRNVASTFESPRSPSGNTGGKAGEIIFPTSDRYTNPTLCCSLRSTGCARLLLQVLGILRTASAGSNSGQVTHENVKALISAHPDQMLRSVGPDIVGEDFPATCHWGSAIGYLREHSDIFIDVNLKVLEGVLPKHMGEVRVAFQRVDPEGMGIADIQDFLSAIRDVSSVGGFCLEANYPGLEIALKDLLVDGPMLDGSSRESCPMTWEELLALMVEGEDAHHSGKYERKRETQRRLLGVRVRLLTGRSCQTHTNNLPAACKQLSAALSELQRLGMEEALSCVPVLYALADTLVLSHRRHSEKITTRAKKLAQDWIQGKEGQEVCKQVCSSTDKMEDWKECKRQLEECRRRLEAIPPAEVEQRTLQTLVTYRAKTIAKELRHESRELETAEEHLLRAWEILESVYGRDHVEVGASCIFLGNLAILRHRLDETENWFRRAHGTFERCFSEEYTPVTASTAVALGNLLIWRGSRTGQNSVEQPGIYHSQERLLLEASAFLEKAAGFYSGRVEAALRAKRDTGDAGGEPSPGLGGNKFAWSDPYVAGSLLDPQTANFAERAADLWMHAAKLRECVHAPAGSAASENVVPVENKCGASRGVAGVLATILEQAARATEISKGPCSIALAKICMKLGEIRKVKGDYPGAQGAFSRARVVYTDHYGRQHPRSKRAAAAVVAAAAAVPALSSASR